MKTWPKTWLAAAAALLIAAFARPVLADDAPRLALIINQVDYQGQGLSPLPDTDAEAADMKASLTKLGFDVTTARDLQVQATPGHPSFKQVLDDFRLKVSNLPGAIVFVYYTGHGMHDPTDTSGGNNYLLGVDANVRVAADLPASGIDLNQLSTQFSRAGTKAVIIVLDACRDTPSLGKGVSKGLAAVPPQENTLIAYSTAEGQIAQTGVYAPVLAKDLLKPGMITDVFGNVMRDVHQATGGVQNPWVNNQIYEAICLVSCEVNINVQAPATGDSGMSEAAQIEKTFFTSAQSCDDYRAYLDKYPNGSYVPLAKGKLAAPACQTAPDVAAVTPAQQQTQQPLAMDAAYRCDLEAGEQFDDDRPAANPYVAPGKMVPDRALAACQAALDADPDNRHLMYNLAEAHRWAATADDTLKAAPLLRTAADKGSAAAMYAIGIMYSRGEGGIAVDDVKAKDWFQVSANAGNAEAMAWLGMFDSAGRGGPVDPAGALDWNQRAAAKGVNYAMANIAAMYYYGTGVVQNYADARDWYEKAADLGFVGAMTAVAHLYEQGLGVTMNYPMAMQWYQKAAALGDVDSMAMLGNMYYNGEGAQPDANMARQWYERAGSLGNVASMAMTGAMYQQGLGGPQDITRAKYWYQLAASKGDTYSQTQLAAMPN